MDSATFIIGAISIAIFILPFAVTRMNRKKQEKQLLQSLSNLAKQHNCKITQHEFCSDFVIGLDENANSLFFFKRHRQNGNKETAHHINLSEFQNCNIINKNRVVKSNGSDSKVIDRLELSFTPVAKNQPAFLLELYNSEESFQLVGELQLIEKWSKLINEKIKHQKKKVEQ